MGRFCAPPTRRAVSYSANGAAPVPDPDLFWLNPSRWGKVQRTGRAAPQLLIGKFCRLLKYFHKHFAREFAGLGVLVRRMV